MPSWTTSRRPTQTSAAHTLPATAAPRGAGHAPAEHRHELRAWPGRRWAGAPLSACSDSLSACSALPPGRAGGPAPGAARRARAWAAPRRIVPNPQPILAGTVPCPGCEGFPTIYRHTPDFSRFAGLKLNFHYIVRAPARPPARPPAQSRRPQLPPLPRPADSPGGSPCGAFRGSPCGAVRGSPCGACPACSRAPALDARLCPAQCRPDPRGLAARRPAGGARARGGCPAPQRRARTGCRRRPRLRRARPRMSTCLTGRQGRPAACAGVPLEARPRQPPGACASRGKLRAPPRAC